MDKFRLVARSAGRYRCGEGGIPHVWETYTVPPFDKTRCMCGLLTWKEGVVLARRRWLERAGAGGSSAVLPQGKSDTPGV